MVANAGPPDPGEWLDYAEAMALELAALCAEAGASGAAERFGEAAAALARRKGPQPPDPNAARGEAA
jgi:hypothetical protein